MTIYNHMPTQKVYWYAPRGIVPWLASQTDMLADDWYEVKEGFDGNERNATHLSE